VIFYSYLIYTYININLFLLDTYRPLPETVWLKDGRPIQSNERVSQGNYGKSLVIKKVKFEDKGKYTCEVSNGVGSPQSYNIELDVMGIKMLYLH